MLQLFTNYSFITVALGTILLAFATSIIGSINVLTQQSLIGDTLGHAAYPGVIFVFMLFQTKSIYLLTLGAVVSGYVSYFLIYWLKKNTTHSYINLLAIVSSAFFGLGMVLQTILQNLPNQSSQQAGLKHYIFGQAAFIQMEDIVLLCIIVSICLSLFFIFFEPYKLFLADKNYAQTVGVPVVFLEQLSIFMTILLIAIGVKTVGTILISSFLIAPSITGLLLANTYQKALQYAVITGCSASLLGAYCSSFISGLSTGPSIILFMTLFCAIAFLHQTKGEKYA